MTAQPTERDRENDPDETEGRALYRARADAKAAADVNVARRRAAIRSLSEDPANG